MRLVNPAGLLLGLLALPVLALHVLRPRRQAATVSSTYLWRRVERPVSAAKPWQRLRPSWLLLAQLLSVALLTAAVARPVRLTPAPLAAHTVFIVDDSGSMAARDGKPTRLDTARQRAVALRRQLPEGGVASVVVASPQPQVLLTASPDSDAFAEAINRVGEPLGSASFADAFLLAASLETPDSPIGFVFLTDGGLTDAERRLLPDGTRIETVGESATNRAIVSLAVEQRASGLTAHVTVADTGGGDASESLRLDVDGVTAHTELLRLADGGTKTVDVDVPAGDRVEAFLEGEDLLAVDDHAYAVTATRPPLRVLVVGTPDPFLDDALDVIPGLAVTRADVPTAGPARPADGFDLVVYDGVAVPAQPGAPWFAIAPPGGAPGVTVAGVVERPALTVVHDDDRLLRGLDLSGVGIAQTQQVAAPADTALVAADSTPLLVRGRRDGRPFVYLGFRLGDSNLPVQVAYPLLVDRLVSELAGTTTEQTDLHLGDRVPVPGDGAVAVRSPDGTTTALPAGALGPVTDHGGYWTVTPDGRAARTYAVNAAVGESALKPVQLPTPPARPLRPGERAPAGERSVLPWLAAALVVVLAAEWFLARRRLGVPRRQWRLATVLRLATLALVALALLSPALVRKVDKVATVFVVDASDSLGGAGRQQADQWVRDALAAQPRGARAGVVRFGGDARVELTVQPEATLSGGTVNVDASRTNLASALRLGAALLPADARRRLVLVSDGRPTEGATADEVDTLRAAGVPVDVHVVERAGGQDAAVTRVDLPGTVREGEAYQVRATIVSNTAGPAEVELRRDGKTVDTKSLTLAAGQDTVVSFDQVADKAGTRRYDIVVHQGGDIVAQNDAGFGAAVVEGRARVLVVEGIDGEANAIADALTAGGVLVDRVGVAAVPTVEQLAGYSATVLVDVDAKTLSGPQVAALAAATRDAGRGLVTIGGDHAYELGGYRNSELEALLPVVSEVLDPKRRLDVAQVLAIDTSGSMGACHCAAGSTLNGVIAGGNLIGPNGGVSKTDISKAAAARTIEAMNANDEVGVLAFNGTRKWVVPLQKLPSQEVVTKGLRSLTPDGQTDVTKPLLDAAESLRASKAKLKHIILFTDGFTQPGNLDELTKQAKTLSDEGITISVLATGEVAYDQLKKVADAGRGRFYAGEDLQKVPQIMVQEAMLAARDVVVEGSFLPAVTSNAAPVRSLTAAPPLLGYVATTAKPTAATHLAVGEEHDPLLASWQVGLGKVTSWTSDASARWSQQWAAWDGYVSFWTGVVKDVFPLAGASGSGVRSSVVGDRLKISVESASGWPDGATATARVTGPDLRGTEVPLTRRADGSFEGEVSAAQAGVYAVGAGVVGPNGPLLSGTTLASQASAPEYRPGLADPGVLIDLSARTGGRGAIAAKAAFDRDGLRAGRARTPLTGLLLLLAALAWPVAVALSRLSLRGSVVGATGRSVRGAVRRVLARAPRPSDSRGQPAAAQRPSVDLVGDVPPLPTGRAGAGDGAAAPDTAPQPADDTLSRLLARKRSTG